MEMKINLTEEERDILKKASTIFHNMHDSMGNSSNKVISSDGYFISRNEIFDSYMAADILSRAEKLD